MIIVRLYPSADCFLYSTSGSSVSEGTHSFPQIKIRSAHSFKVVSRKKTARETGLCIKCKNDIHEIIRKIPKNNKTENTNQKLF